jgi:hypothetical protein
LFNDRDKDMYYIDLDYDRGGPRCDEDDEDEDGAYDSDFSVGLSSEYSASGFSEYSTRSAATDPRGFSSSAAPRLFSYDPLRGTRRGSCSRAPRDRGSSSDGSGNTRGGEGLNGGTGFKPRRALTRGGVVSEGASLGVDGCNRAQPAAVELEGAHELAPALRALLVLHFLYDPGVSVRGCRLNNGRPHERSAP